MRSVIITLLLLVGFSTGVSAQSFVEISFFHEDQPVRIVTSINQPASFSVEGEENGFNLILTPILRRDNTLAIDIYTAKDDNNARQGGPNFTPSFDKAEFLETVPMFNNRGNSESFGLITLRSIDIEDFQISLTSVEGKEVQTRGGSCCVTCGGTTACGAAVSLGCGSCRIF